MQYRGLHLTARSEQRSRCTVLQITAETQAAICTPSPARISVLCSKPAPQSPQPPSHPNHSVGNTGKRLRSDLFQAGQAEMVLLSPPKYILGNLCGSRAASHATSHALAWTRSQGRAVLRQRWRLHGRPVPLNCYTSLP